ncbi:MAG: hypothetical protein ABIG35_09980 [Pseudomonadota bacterium]
MLKSMKTLIAIAIAIALAFALNPSAEKHRDKIKTAIAERSQIERILGIGQLTSFVSTYHSLGVASYTTVNEKVTSIGVFGLVFVP